MLIQQWCTTLGYYAPYLACYMANDVLEYIKLYALQVVYSLLSASFLCCPYFSYSRPYVFALFFTDFFIIYFYFETGELSKTKIGSEDWGSTAHTWKELSLSFSEIH